MSPDVAVDRWTPRSDADVCFLLELEIGEEGVDWAGLFQVVVATPLGLQRLARPDDPVISRRGLIVLSTFSWPTLHRIVDEIVTQCAADEWEESARRLQRFFMYEYEDYIQEPDA